MQGQFFFLLPFDLFAGHRFRAEIGDCRTKNPHVGSRETGLRCLIHFLSRFHIYPVDTRMLRFQLHRSGDQRHLCPTTGTFFRQSKSHLTGRIIADKTDRIDLFVSRSGSYHNFPSLKFGTRREKLVQHSDNVFRFFHTSFADQMAGKFTRCGLNDAVAVGTQYIQILLCRRMCIHIEVHSRCNEYRSFGRKISGYQHIVCYPVRHLSDGGGGSGCDQHGIRPQTQVHMAVPRTVPLGKKLADDRLTGQSRKSDGSNKFFSRRSNYDLHFRSLFYQSANDIARLIRGNTAGNSKNYFLSF